MLDDAPLPEGWQWAKLGDLANPRGRPIVSGPFGSNISSRFFVSSGVPVIRGNNLTCGGQQFLDDGFVFVTPEKAEALGNVDAVCDDLIITAAGTLGQVGIIPRDAKYPLYVISNKQIRVRVDPSRVLPRFAYYWLSSSGMRKYIEQRNTGSSVPLINLTVVRALPIPVPGIREQEAIVETLAALDDKIEQNRRTGRALEGLARATFKAWFVDFEPVKAKAAGQTSFPGLPPAAFAALPARLTGSPIGPVPEGWEIGKLGDLLSERGERMTPGDETRQLPYVPIDCITSKRVTLETFKSGEEAQSSLIRFQSGDILFGAMRPYFHKVCLAPFSGTTRTTCFVLAPRSDSDRNYALMLASEDATVQFATTHSVGSTIPYAKWQSSLREMPCVLPPESLRAAYHAIAEPMLQLSNQGVGESAKLAALRDYLLPRLLSGRVRVSNVELPTKEAL